MSDEQQKNPELEEEAVAAEAAQEAGVEGGEELSVEALSAQLEEAQQQLADAKDQAVRAVAESQNVRRRAEKEVENARKFALERFAGEMLGVVDNLERAMDAIDRENEEVKPLLEGIELTHKSLIDALGRHQVSQIDPVGEPFDPQFHEAMSMVPSPDAEPNTVLAVMQKGYTLNGRLLRAAMVVVAQG